MDISKLHMFKFHYLVMKPLFNNQLEVCFTDTDSFLYKIYKSNIDKELRQISSCLDFSNYDPKHPLYSLANKKRPGR